MICTIMLIGTSCKKQEIKTDKTATEMGEALKGELGLTEGIILDQDKFDYFYGINKDSVLEYYVVVGDNINADELAVIQAKEGSAEEVKKGVEARLNAQKESFKDYLPEEYKVLESAIITQKGDYIFYCAGEEAEKVKLSFDKFFE